MGPTLSVSTKIEIAASPAIVRSAFMNWPRYPQWQPNPNWNLQPQNPTTGTKSPLDLKEGEPLSVSMDGKAHNPTVVENSPAAFKWRGSLFGLGAGVHQFHFTPSEVTPGHTTFVQKEDFDGVVITLSSPWWKGRDFSKETGPWDAFNQCLKVEAERLAKEADGKQ